MLLFIILMFEVFLFDLIFVNKVAVMEDIFQTCSDNKVIKSDFDQLLHRNKFLVKNPNYFCFQVFCLFVSVL